MLREIDRKGREANQASSRFRAGIRIVREWKGKTHEVTITAAGYVYGGQEFQSLSPIARLITGTRWSGPAFFETRKGDRNDEARKPIRCAAYTRKSFEEGLEQSCNSLDAQREACEAYTLSQKHEGWQPLAFRYDDGGFSGGNMERPGLKKLLSDISADKVDTVVVYKVDRLTRFLADFAKIVESFDGKGVSFVSVTQQFNTTTSMGRLTLNVLLSFAQFDARSPESASGRR